jgi:transcriptional regulator with XRE-family HTH domain
MSARRHHLTMLSRSRRWEHSKEPRRGLEQRGYELIGERLKELRRGASLTQRRLEVLTGIDQTVISRLENGKQYGLRWSRYAILIGVLEERQVSRVGPIPWWVALGKEPRPGRSDDAVERPQAAVERPQAAVDALE